MQRDNHSTQFTSDNSFLSLDRSVDAQILKETTRQERLIVYNIISPSSIKPDAHASLRIVINSRQEKH